MCQRVLAIPFKRTTTRPVEYFEDADVQAVLGAIDRRTRDRRRDYALLATMFNTGAHEQEVVSLSVGDLRLDRPPQVRLMGKGRKSECARSEEFARNGEDVREADFGLANRCPGRF